MFVSKSGEKLEETSTLEQPIIDPYLHHQEESIEHNKHHDEVLEWS